MGAKTVVKRQNIASLDRSKDIPSRHKTGKWIYAPHYDREDITWIYSSKQNPSWCPNNGYMMVPSPKRTRLLPQETRQSIDINEVNYCLTINPFYSERLSL